MTALSDYKPRSALGDLFHVERAGEHVGLRWRFIVKQATITREDARKIAVALLEAAEGND